MNSIEAEQIFKLLDRNDLGETKPTLEEIRENLYFIDYDKDEGDDRIIVACARAKQVQWYQWELCHLSVALEHESTGKAYKVARKAIQHAIDNGAKIIQCTISETNYKSWRLCERNGFKKATRFYNDKSKKNLLLYHRVVKEKISETDVWIYIRNTLVSFSAIMSMLGFLFVKIPVILSSYIPLALTNLYLVSILAIAALKSDNRINDNKMYTRLMPTKTTGLMFFAVLFLATTLAYARIFLDYPSEIKPIIITHFDAFYFSFITMTTLGYGDVAPITDFAKQIVMWEFGSALLLFTGGLGLLLSRLASYK